LFYHFYIFIFCDTFLLFLIFILQLAIKIKNNFNNLNNKNNKINKIIKSEINIILHLDCLLGHTATDFLF